MVHWPHRFGKAHQRRKPHAHIQNTTCLPVGFVFLGFFHLQLQDDSAALKHALKNKSPPNIIKAKLQLFILRFWLRCCKKLFNTFNIRSLNLHSDACLSYDCSCSIKISRTKFMLYILNKIKIISICICMSRAATIELSQMHQ